MTDCVFRFDVNEFKDFSLEKVWLLMDYDDMISPFAISSLEKNGESVTVPIIGISYLL